MRYCVALLSFFLLSITVFAQDTHIINFDSTNQSYLGKQYPPFKITTADGKTINNASIKGKVTLISFWYAGCQSYLGEITLLNIISDYLKNDPNYLQLSVTFDPKESLPAFIKEHNIHGVVATTGNNKECNKMHYQNNAYPFNILIDKDGKVAMIFDKIDNNTEITSEFRTMSIQDVFKKIKSIL